MKTPTPPNIESPRFCPALIGFLLGRRKGTTSLVAVFASLLLACHAQALLLTNQTLNVTLLPNSSYEVSLDLSTSAVSSLLTTLDGLTSDVLQVVDANGTVLGSIPAADLIEAINDATGGVVGGVLGGDLTQPITFILNTVDEVVDPVLQTLETPLLSVSNVSVTPVTTSAGKKVDNAPTVRIKKRQSVNARLKISGTAADDQQVTSVTVKTNGRVRKAKGTANWKSTGKLRKGVNRIVVRAYDNTQHISAPQRVKVIVQ
ncbi:MAG TPA: hypothetical protein VIM61_02645 [Chthoniobacterales bacterium]